MTAIQQIESSALVPQQVERMKTSLPPLRGRYPKDQAEADATKRAVRSLDTQAEPGWIAQRVATFLPHFYISELHPAQMSAMASDWTRELAGYPEWAIEAALQWWISADNPKLGTKPLPGHISKRAKAETAIIEAGRNQVIFFERYGNKPPAFLR